MRKKENINRQYMIIKYQLKLRLPRDFQTSADFPLVNIHFLMLFALRKSTERYQIHALATSSNCVQILFSRTIFPLTQNLPYNIALNIESPMKSDLHLELIFIVKHLFLC